MNQQYPQTNQEPANITPDDLAVMIKAGFDNTATKQDLKVLENGLRADIAKIDERLQIVETKLDRALYTERNTSISKRELNDWKKKSASSLPKQRILIFR